MRQVEVSRTLVFDARRRARAFFEALIADNLDIDRPAVGPDTGGVVLNVFYKHSRIKQYLKDGRAMRIETVINAPRDLGCNCGCENLCHLGRCSAQRGPASSAGEPVLARPDMR